MKDKIEKLISVLKKDGIKVFTKKSFKYVKSNFLTLFNIKYYIDYIKNKKKYLNHIDQILNDKNYDRIVIWRSSFGWNVPLYQRPQHISINLSKQNCLVFYEVTKMTDNVKTITEINSNLYLVNFKNKLFSNLLLKKIGLINKPKYLQFYSTDWTLDVNYMKKSINNGYKIIYEYIDDISPLLSGTIKIPINVKDKYDYAMNDENIIVVVTADILKEDVINKRGTKNLVFSSNGVDYNFFKVFDNESNLEKNFLDVVNNKKISICYYGALASWFDYELIRKISDMDKYNIILFGIKYDNTFDNSKIESLKNIYFFGSKDYKILKNYAVQVDILMIPFLINDITKSTSPVKLFEYMALKKPIVTTNMNECRKYESVLISNNHNEFLLNLEKAIKLKNDEKYLSLLDQEAKDNDWFEKAKVIVDKLKEGE